MRRPSTRRGSHRRCVDQWPRRGEYRRKVPELVLHHRTIATVFDLLGRDENDMTASLGWGLAHNAALLRRFLERIAPDVVLAEPPAVELQKHGRADGGFTDIELMARELHVIVEAKRGWDPPSEAQLRRYEDRFAETSAPAQRFVVLTQNGAERVVRHRLGAWVPAPPIILAVLGWSDLVSMASSAGHEGPSAERHLAGELATYLRGVADMRDTNTNEVHVVVLTRKVWDGWPTDLSPVDEVEKHRLYHYPTVGNYRRIVPNYMGFRYDGRLQSIHHVDSYEIIDTPHGHVPGAPDLLWDAPVNLLHLGPPIRPDHKVPTGKGIWPNAPAVVDIDLLLTSTTIVEARNATKLRRSA
jgi:hypothetical protein